MKSLLTSKVNRDYIQIKTQQRASIQMPTIYKNTPSYKIYLSWLVIVDLYETINLEVVLRDLQKISDIAKVMTKNPMPLKVA